MPKLRDPLKIRIAKRGCGAGSGASTVAFYNIKRQNGNSARSRLKERGGVMSRILPGVCFCVFSGFAMIVGLQCL